MHTRETKQVHISLSFEHEPLSPQPKSDSTLKNSFEEGGQNFKFWEHFFKSGKWAKGAKAITLSEKFWTANFRHDIENLLKKLRERELKGGGLEKPQPDSNFARA